ncbi:MAG: alpha/beta hydrolase [Pseudomonadota bacterium]
MSDTSKSDIERNTFTVAMRDGEILKGWRYARGSGETGSDHHLLALPDELGNARQLASLAHALLAQDHGPASIITTDMRGRGLSRDAKSDDTDVETDARDLISICDALNLHHADILVTGRSSGILFNALPSRPTLCRKVVLNDAAPAFDPVGIAANTALVQREGAPGDWKEAVARLIDRRPWLDERSDEEALAYAKTVWRNNDGKPAHDRARDLLRASNSGNFDDKQAEYWKEFAVLKNTPLLLIHGGESKLVTPNEIERMKKVAGKSLTVVEAEGQSHPPELAVGALPKTVADFLAS